MRIIFHTNMLSFLYRYFQFPVFLFQFFTIEQILIFSKKSAYGFSKKIVPLEKHEKWSKVVSRRAS